MKNLGLDFDDILFDFNNKYCHFINDKYGTNLCFDDIYTYDMDIVWKIDKSEVIRRVEEFILSQAHEEVFPVPGAVDALRDLSKSYNLHVITSRNEKFRDKTVNWLNKHFPNVFNKVHFTNFYETNEKKVNKSNVCKENSISIMVEDAPVHAEDLALNGIEVLMLDKPWNRVETHRLVKRVASWQEIVARL